MHFNGSEHEQFFNKYESEDVYRNCLWYLIGVSDITRSHVDDIYDFEEHSIKPEVLNAGWLTSSTSALIRLAFDLYHSDPVLSDDNLDNEKKETELTLYSVSNIFSRLNEWRIYALEAIAMMYTD